MDRTIFLTSFSDIARWRWIFRAEINKNKQLIGRNSSRRK